MRRVRLIIISMLLICSIESFAFADSQFTDIKENVWYSEGVSYVVSKGYMVGTGYRRFDPNKTLNRAQLAQILYAYDGKPEIEVEDFVDTKKNSWFSSAATYVTKGGSTMFDYPPHLETGYFDPCATVTREQFVFVLYNFSWRHDKDMEIDSISWETDPLYGWCNKNTRRGGQPYNINTDGLRIYTTIDTRMQKYAEEAVLEHLSQTLQPAFNSQTRGSSKGPFSSKMSRQDYERVMNRAIRQSHRYQILKSLGASEADIKKNFEKPIPMKVFTYNGEVDKVMSPLDSILYYKTFLRAGFMSMEVHTGAVKAYVGGPNYEYFQYDMAMVGRRQVGSTIKPYLYSLAMENGYTPCDKAPNRAQTYYVAGGRWTPRNGSRARYGAMVTLKWGLQQSNNWISAYLMNKFHPQALVDLLKKYGINNPQIKATMALCLGPCEVTVGEMVSAYTTFPNKGIRCAPYMVTRIEDSEGNILANFHPIYTEVISESSSYKMLELLRAVVDGGTGRGVRGSVSGEIGGKTGTTNNNADAWFMGFTPELVSGVWVGGEDRDIHFYSMAYGQGAKAALPIWGKYMRKVYADASLEYSSSAKFDVPKDFDTCDDKPSQNEYSIEDVYE